MEAWFGTDAVLTEDIKGYLQYLLDLRLDGHSSSHSKVMERIHKMYDDADVVEDLRLTEGQVFRWIDAKAKEERQ